MSDSVLVYSQNDTVCNEVLWKVMPAHDDPLAYSFYSQSLGGTWVAVTNKWVSLEEFLDAADVTWGPGMSLKIHVSYGSTGGTSGPGEYTLYSDFTYANLTATDRFFFPDGGPTTPEALFEGDGEPVPTVIALQTAMRSIVNTAENTKDSIFGDYGTNPLPDTTAPRLLSGLRTGDGGVDDAGGNRLPQYISEIHVYGD